MRIRWLQILKYYFIFILTGCSLGKLHSVKPRISIITSIYKCESFVACFLEDIVNQTIFLECELFLIDANSPENEKVIIDQYLQRYPNIFYVRLAKDPGLYSVWNLAINLSRAEYITNANVDDRLAFDCYEAHAFALDHNPDYDLVYSDRYHSTVPNENFAKCEQNFRPMTSFGETTNESIYYCVPNNHPMWRKSMHDKYGYFNESFRSAGDWDFWLRAYTRGSKFFYINRPLAVFYINRKGLSHSKPHLNEVKKIEKQYHHLWKRS